MKNDWPGFREEDRGYATPCHIWQGHIMRNGYAMYGKTLVHRMLYLQTVGAIPDDYDLDHRCRVRACVNPAHLEPVTRQENCRRGLTGAHLRKLTIADRLTIHASREPGVVLARRYGVTPTRISQIRGVA